MNPHEVMCTSIKTFKLNSLKQLDPSKIPVKQYKLNPRERLMQAVLAGTPLKRALVVAGYDINNLMVQVPNHPTFGTIFRDVSALFTVPKVSLAIAQQICSRFTGDPPDLFVATPTDAGVFFASLVAEFFNRGVIVLQNAGRLPRKMEKYSCGYETLGYVSHSLELQLQKNLVKENTRVVLIDEMLVNGGILEAARVILRETGARLKEVICIAELEGFGGRAKIKSFECNVHALYVFNDNQVEQFR
jgi:adenine phosphoribosyltransferase